ncbi:MAG TPA: O-antigen ligase family protein [Thermoanaerobaculaceae bacterium]|nr:O-antigen ligase family protein [Thermoanaerobaculaceae bacterium]
MAMREWLDRYPFLVRVMLVAVALFLVFLPLPFGSVVPWSHAVIQVTAFLLLAVAAVLAPSVAEIRPAILPAACLAAVGLVAAIQGSTVPATIVRNLSPEHARLQAGAAAVARGSGLERAVPSTLSLNPTASHAAALMFLAVAASLLAAAALSAQRKDRRLLAWALVASGLFQVLLGASNLRRSPTAIWGIQVPNDPLRLRGSFVNPDHMALYLELVLPVVFAWGWWAVRRAGFDPRIDRRVAFIAPPVMAWLTLFVGLAFTGSRAALVAACTGAALQGLLLAIRRRRWRRGVAGVVAALVGIGAVAFIGLQQGLGRWLGTSQYELTWSDRLDVYRHALALWQRFPLTGTGLATFRDAFTLVAPHELSQNWYWHAHNDWLEVLVTTGVIGAALVLIGLVAAVRGLVPVLRKGERSEDRAAALAALGALASVAVHSCFDFGLTMPANSVTLAIIVGAALVAPRTEGQT